MNIMSFLPRILIVEDESDVVQQLIKLLHHADYDTLVAPRGDGALAAVHLHRPDLVLIDIAAPGCNGISILHAIHTIDPELPSIIITRDGCLQEVRGAMLNGAFDFFTRPYDNLELLSSIAAALASRRAMAGWQEVGIV